VRLQLVRPPDALHGTKEMPMALAIARPIQWVAWCGGAVQVKTGYCATATRAPSYVTDLANVRDAIPIPRTPGNARY
jgi:hypothetical protein